jgi:hypothetical protein
VPEPFASLVLEYYYDYESSTPRLTPMPPSAPTHRRLPARGGARGAGRDGVRAARGGAGARVRAGLGSHSFPISAQLELTLPLSAQLKLTVSPILPNVTRGCVPKMLKCSSNVSDVFPKVLKLSSDVSDVFPEVLKLSSEVSECKSLGGGAAQRVRRGGGAGGKPRQGLTLVHSSAQLERFVWDRGCT